MQKKKPSMESYFKLPNPGLWAYFKHVESGNTEDYRPPFWSDLSRESVLELWQKEIDKLGVKHNYPDLYAFEMDMKSKVGPMSIQLPLKDRIPSIEEYYEALYLGSKAIPDTAIAATIDFFSKAGGIRLRSKEKVMENMRLNTNSGTPYFTKRKLVTEETKRSSLVVNTHDELIQELYHDYSHTSEYKLAAVLGWRGQEGGIHEEDVKQRVVWMMPFLLNVEELRFYQPAITAMQKNDLIPAYISMDRVDQEITALFDTKGPNDDVVCTDFKAFDQHFNEDMQKAAYKVESALTSGDQFSQWAGTGFWPKFKIPLICSEGIMYTGDHGMGSGSGGTNFDECMAHKCLQFEAAINDHQRLNPHSMAYGDDGILTYPGITVDSVIQTYTSHGQEMNPTKQYVSKHDCVVLRRWHGMNYRVNNIMVGVYSTFRALGRLLAQERFYDPEKWSKKMVILRALSIIENCKWSPYFHEFIDFVITGDKFRLGLDLPGFFDELPKLAKEATEEFQDFLGYTKTLQDPQLDSTATGIANWEVVKYLRSKQ